MLVDIAITYEIPYAPSLALCIKELLFHTLCIEVYHLQIEPGNALLAHMDGYTRPILRLHFVEREIVNYLELNKNNF